MVEDLIPVLRLLAFATASGVAGYACGQVLPDPMRPPDALRPPVDGVPGVAASSLPRSQPVVIVSGGRRQVTIDGQTATIGGRIRDATVISISDTEVVLRNADKTETIRLYGDVEKKLLKPKPEVSQATRAARSETGR